MRKARRFLLVTALAVSGALGVTGVARAAITNSTGTNVQSGDNRATGNQNGASKSGDAVGGQVTGVVSSGRTSVDARNTTSNSDVTSGDARGGNTAGAFTGLNNSANVTVGGAAADISGVSADNLQEGNNRTTYSQSANYTTGDGVAGEVIGAVTSAGGSASIVAANTTNDSSVQTGDARGSNEFDAFTGLNNGNDKFPITIGDIANSCTTECINVQEGDNRTTGRQSSIASTGDGVAGQVIGSVSSGATSIDARNTSDSVDVTTGDARADNDSGSFVGLNGAGDTSIGGTDISGVPQADNLQEGRNTATINQSASATTGDGVGGQVIGSVTSAGGSASIVAANTSKNTDISTGDSSAANSLDAFVGLDDSGGSLIVDISGSCGGDCDNVQQGSNRFTGSQTATSATGDGVGGQVLGVVSAGLASLDATNTTSEVSVDTGNSSATNSGDEFVGLNSVDGSTTIADINGVPNAHNLQEGDNRKALSQAADATSGDGVAGQVSGVVTSAGGSASVVVANTSTSIDSSTGSSNFTNDDHAFVGQNFGHGSLTV